MSFWRRLFATDVPGLVGKARVFGTDSECLDDGPDDVAPLLELLARIVREHLTIEDARGTRGDKKWSASFRAAGRTWKTELDPRDYGPIFGLVNEALDHVKAPRRVHVVSHRRGGQDFQVAHATPDDVNVLLSKGWLVERAAPHFPHVLVHEGLRFHGDRPWRLTDRGSVLEAVPVDAAVIQGVPCAAGESVHFDYEGRLVSAVVTEDVEIEGRPVRAGTRFTLDE